MKINKRSIVKQIKAEQELAARGRISLYINRKVTKEFMAECKRQGLSASIVVEKMMAQFTGSNGK
ncbi:MAG: hypothetical protein AB7F86_09645 [Bdellovibrionales bacterium]